MKRIGAALVFAFTGLSVGQQLPQDQTFGATVEVVATLRGPIPTGVTVSNDGRIFVNYPQWGDKPAFTVAEIKDGKPAAYPSVAMNTADAAHAPDCLVSVQSVVVDPTGKRLWILDTARGAPEQASCGGPKMVGVDLATNKVIKNILFPSNVALAKTYLNDVRFDLRRGAGGMAFITDSGAPGIIVVDLVTGKSWRRLDNDPSTQADPNFVMIFEGRVTMHYGPGQKPSFPRIGSDGIAITADGKWLYYSPLSGRHLYRVSVDALADQAKADADVAKTVEDLGEKGGPSDGLESDAEGRIYITDYEHDSIHRRNVDGTLETLVHDPRILWPDTLSLAADGYLYFTANQLARQSQYQKDGSDRREQPYPIFRIKVDGTRIGQ